ncbi:Rhamnogalacturonate lyase family protein [Quillaja saponaria]|uniref:rhamnogalacturonan endolyase n=1 Tax=Quillaja saponaria TaxID=32244 RepID=A0AAD7L8G4_QUISA|nr:Rhamnogalacturonate lyase family protein [Quillaja saponaria]
MEIIREASGTRKWGLIIMHLLLLLGDCLCSSRTTNIPLQDTFSKGRELSSSSSSPAVKLHVENHEQVVIENGLVRVTLSIPEGDVLGIEYKGIDNVLESQNQDYDRGYLDVVWNQPGKQSAFERIKGTNFSIVMENEDQVEVSFLKTWKSSMEGSSIPVNIDKRYILLKDSSGFYSYFIFERLEGWPDIKIDQIRIVFKLKEDMFKFMAITDERQRLMPTAMDRSKGEKLAYPEAVLLTNPSDPAFKGEVDDKYQYSIANKDNTLHGWICFKSDPRVGFWMITPSTEFRNAGPMKQDLTSHVGPTTLSMFVSTHYGGKDLTMQFRGGKPWKKVFGPVFVYLNFDRHSSSLWRDAQKQKSIEMESWPYVFPQSKDFLPSKQRGTVTGKLVVKDQYINSPNVADSAHVGLALPGNVGSWQTESMGYQFWTQANNSGDFIIKNIIPGDYNLYAYVPGIIGDYKYYSNITIKPGGVINLGDLVYSPPRNGPTLWEIGIPDRTAKEFYVPEPYPNLSNKLLNREPNNKFRQYGLWERYTDLYPKNDIVYNVTTSDYHRDWFFAHVNRKIGNKTYEPTTWQIIFQLENPNQQGNYTLQLALASANEAELEVRINDPKIDNPVFSTGLIGRDNAIARHGIYGLYRFYSINIAGNLTVKGKNTIYLRQARRTGPFEGLMYDYLRLEGPPQK